MSSRCPSCGADTTASKSTCLQCGHVLQRNPSDNTPPPGARQPDGGPDPAVVQLALPAASSQSRLSPWWLAPILLLAVVVSYLHWYAIPAADTYAALDHEQTIRSQLVLAVLPKIASLADLPAGDPKSIAEMQAKVDVFAKQLEAKAVALEGDVTTATLELTAAQEELKEVNGLGTLHRIRERRASGSRYVSDWYGGHYETTYSSAFKLCGDDQCGSTCGNCAETELCFGGYCRCIPKCEYKVCGSDGCGGSCGSCGSGSQCDDGQCLAPQQPQAAVAGCTPVCADAAVSGKPGRSARSGAKDSKEDLPPPGSLAEQLRMAFGRVTGRSQPLEPDQLDGWIAALDAEVTALDGVVAEVAAARSSLATLRAEVLVLDGQVKPARAALAGAKAATALARKAQAGAAPDGEAQVTAAGQKEAELAAALQQLIQTIASKKREVADADKRSKALEKRSKTAATQQPLVAQERAAFAQLRERKLAALTRLQAAERQLAARQAAKVSGVSALRGALAPQLGPLESQLAALQQPFVPAANVPLGHAHGGRSGDHPAAPESPSHLAARSLQGSTALQERLENYLQACQQQVALRRAAWTALSAAERTKFPGWPEQDDALERLTGQLSGLLQSNARLARIWRRLGS